MTMVVGISSGPLALMVSDRLVSLQRPSGQLVGPHNRIANKAILYWTTDAMVTLGYTGPAYVDGALTDDWIAARILACAAEDFENVVMGNKGPKRRLAQTLFGLAQDIAAHPTARALEILAVGHRWDKYGRATPVHVRIKNGRIGPHLRRRYPSTTFLYSSIGIDANLEEHKTFVEEGSLKWYTSGRRLDILTDSMRTLVRSVSARSPGVGASLMEVAVHLGSSISIKYLPDPDRSDISQDLLFGPWIITPAGIWPPTQMTGAGRTFLGVRNSWFHVTLELVPEVHQASENGVVYEPAPRPSAPGARKR